MAPKPTNGQPVLLGRLITVCGPVVVTVRVVLPLVDKEVGFMAQVLSVMAAGTEQVKLIVPLNPLTAVAVIIEV